MLARERQRLQTLAGLQGLVALGVEQIMKELHVQLVILDDEDFLGGHITRAIARGVCWRLATPLSGVVFTRISLSPG